MLLIRGTQESALRQQHHRRDQGLDRAAGHRPRLGLHQSGEPHAAHPGAHDLCHAAGITHNYGGIMGILGAAGVVFFAYIGFDAVSTAAQEAKNPKSDMPIGILGSLVVCTVLYVLFSYVLSGVATGRGLPDRRGREASVAFAITKYMTGYGGCRCAVTVAILAGFSSVILVMLLGQSRVFYSMSRDGLVPPVFSDVHPEYQDAVQVELLFFVFTALFAAFIPGRHRRRDDQHRHAVRVHAGVRWRVDHARVGARICARLHGAGASARVRLLGDRDAAVR